MESRDFCKLLCWHLNDRDKLGIQETIDTGVIIMKKLTVAVMMAMVMAVSAGVTLAANGDKCMFNVECGPSGQCIKNKIGPYGVCAGGY